MESGKDILPLQQDPTQLYNAIQDEIEGIKSIEQIKIKIQDFNEKDISIEDILAIIALTNILEDQKEKAETIKMAINKLISSYQGFAPKVQILEGIACLVLAYSGLQSVSASEFSYVLTEIMDNLDGDVRKLRAFNTLLDAIYCSENSALSPDIKEQLGKRLALIRPGKSQDCDYKEIIFQRERAIQAIACIGTQGKKSYSPEKKRAMAFFNAIVAFGAAGGAIAGAVASSGGTAPVAVPAAMLNLMAGLKNTGTALNINMQAHWYESIHDARLYLLEICTPSAEIKYYSDANKLNEIRDRLLSEFSIIKIRIELRWALLDTLSELVHTHPSIEVRTCCLDLITHYAKTGLWDNPERKKNRLDKVKEKAGNSINKKKTWKEKNLTQKAINYLQALAKGYEGKVLQHSLACLKELEKLPERNNKSHYYHSYATHKKFSIPDICFMKVIESHLQQIQHPMNNHPVQEIKSGNTALIPEIKNMQPDKLDVTETKKIKTDYAQKSIKKSSQPAVHSNNSTQSQKESAMTQGSKIFAYNLSKIDQTRAGTMSEVNGTPEDIVQLHALLLKVSPELAKTLIPQSNKTSKEKSEQNHDSQDLSMLEDLVGKGGELHLRDSALYKPTDVKGHLERTNIQNSSAKKQSDVVNVATEFSRMIQDLFTENRGYHFKLKRPNNLSVMITLVGSKEDREKETETLIGILSKLDEIIKKDFQSMTLSQKFSSLTIESENETDLDRLMLLLKQASGKFLTEDYAANIKHTGFFKWLDKMDQHVKTEVNDNDKRNCYIQ